MTKRLLSLAALLLASCSMTADAQVAGCGPGGTAQCLQMPVVVGNPTGGAKGPGSLNAESLFVNGVAAGSPGPQGPPGASGVATTSNDNAAPGAIGEFISSLVTSASAVGLVSTAEVTVTSVSLTAGDWDCSGNVGYAPNAATTVTAYAGGLSPSNTGFGGRFSVRGTWGTTAAAFITPTGSLRYSLPSPATVSLVAMSVFAGGTNAAYGYLGCRRPR